MPRIEIYRINPYISKSYPIEEVCYEFGDTCLRDIIRRYDSRLNDYNAKINIGNDVFKTWSVAIDSCLMYGNCIQLRTSLVPMIIRFEEKELEISLDFRHETVGSLKLRVFGKFGVPPRFQKLRNQNKELVPIDNNLFSAYKINHEEPIEVTMVGTRDKIEGIEIFIAMPTGEKITFRVTTDLTVEELKSKIQDREGTSINQQRMIFAGKQLEDGLTLENYKICNEATIYLVYRLRGGGDMFADLTREAKKYEWNKSAPDWRIAHKGLCLEGRCKNEKCKAFNKMVVINMGVTIFKLGMPTDGQNTSCPMCFKYVKPVLCAFNKCSWRYFGIKETKNGNERVKCDWQIVGNHYQRFEESSQVPWASLVIETKSNFSLLTEPLECGICLSFSPGDENNNTTTALSCMHSFHSYCIEKWFEKSKICPYCDGIYQGIFKNSL